MKGRDGAGQQTDKTQGEAGVRVAREGGDRGVGVEGGDRGVGVEGGDAEEGGGSRGWVKGARWGERDPN